MITGRSAAAAYAQPAAELARLAEAGRVLRVARGYYAAVPVDKVGTDWRPSLESLAAGIAIAVYGVGRGALWGLSAARVHGGLPRAISTGFAFGDRQHRPVQLTTRSGRVMFRKRDPDRLSLETVVTDIGPALVTTVEQTILDLCASPITDPADPRTESVLSLMAMTTEHRVQHLAGRVRGASAWNRARRLAFDARRG